MSQNRGGPNICFLYLEFSFSAPLFWDISISQQMNNGVPVALAKARPHWIFKVVEHVTGLWGQLLCIHRRTIRHFLSRKCGFRLQGLERGQVTVPFKGSKHSSKNVACKNKSDRPQGFQPFLAFTCSWLQRAVTEQRKLGRARAVEPVARAPQLARKARDRRPLLAGALLLTFVNSCKLISGRDWKQQISTQSRESSVTGTEPVRLFFLTICTFFLRCKSWTCEKITNP